MKKSNRRRAGFTMVEIMVTVGILVVLLAVAVPGIIALRANLEMTELDATARAIFVAAQDNLAGMRNAGALKDLAGAPSDGGAAGGRYLTDGDALMPLLLPAGAVDPDTASGRYFVKFDTDYGSVLEVYYAKSTLPGVAELLGGLSGNGDAARQARRDKRVGYYLGDGVAAENVVQLAAPSVSVRDEGNALTVSVSLSDADAATALAAHAQLVLTVKSADGSQSAVLPLTPDSPVQYKAEVTLDSLEPGKQFFTLFPGFTPGCDLRLSAGLQPAAPSVSGGKIYLGAESAALTVNSLFASLEDGGSTAVLTNARHLQNLSSNFSGLAKSSGVVRAVQLTAIDWPDTYTFRPISTSNTSFPPFLTEFNGNSMAISGLKINEAGKPNAGLFDSLSGAALRGVTLVNAEVSGAMDCQGILVGRGEGLTVENCAVYVSVLRASGGSYVYDYPSYSKYGMSAVAQYAGGLMGLAKDCTVTNSFAALPHLSTSGKALGGLIGKAVGCTVRSSYAVADQLGGNSNANGMFIGLAGGGTKIDNCYAAGNMLATSIGSSDALSGFLYGAASVENSYCAVTYLDSNGNMRQDITPTAFTSGGTAQNCAYLFTGLSGPSADGAAALTYDALKSWSGAPGAWTHLTAQKTFPYSASLAGRTYPFPALARGDAAARAEHRGSWPLSPGDFTLAYFEVYGDGSMGFYAPNGVPVSEGGTPVDTLRDGVVVARDGYAFLSPAKNSAPKVTYQSNGQHVEVCTSYSEAQIKVNASNYYVYVLPDKALQSETATGEYQRLYCGGASYWYEPHFAKAIANIKEGGSPQPPLSFTIRSARQLYNLGLHSSLWGKDYDQALDVDFAAYQWEKLGLTGAVPTLKPIGEGAKPFGGKYDGQSHAVLNARLGASGLYGGLFGSVDGSVLDLRLTAESLVIPSGPDAYAGTMVGHNGGAISGCEVVLPKLLSVGAVRFGGFAGRNSGGINGCTVSGSSGKSTVSGLGTVAGFVAESSGTISGCAVRPAPGSGYDGLKLTAGGSGSRAFGFAGSVTGYGIVERSFAAATVTATEAAGFTGLIGDNAGVRSSYANCKVSAAGRAAGFVLDMNGGTANCYTLLSVTSTGGAASGFADYVSGKVTACYAAAEVTGAAKSFGFAGRKNASGIFESCLYMDSGYADADELGTPVDFDDLTAAKQPGFSSSWTDDNADHSFPFDAALQGQAYPFPRLSALDHLGDWPERPAKTLGLVYYEKYANGSYGFFGLDVEEEYANTLKDNRYEIVETGYGFLLPSDQETLPKLTANNDINNPYEAGRAVGPKRKLHPFTQNAYSQLTSGYYNWSNLQVDGVNAYSVNVNFAAAITPYGRSSEMGTEEVPLQVRTQEQLSHVGTNINLPYILQTHDIEITGTWTPLDGGHGNARTLDGGGCKISGLNQPLFDSIQPQSALINLYLTDADVTIAGGASSGILINRRADPLTVTGCTVANSSISGASVAGMFGEIGSANTISGCAVENVSVTATATAAGFAVTINDTSTIKACRVSPADGGDYDGMKVLATDSGATAAGFAAKCFGAISGSFATGTVSAPAGSASGFASSLSGNPSVSSSYSNCVTSGKTAAGFLLSPGAGTVSDCYALLSVSGGDNAYGFSGRDMGWCSISRCYTAVTLAGGDSEQYGFSPSFSSITNCYYLFGPDGGSGTRLSYDQLAAFPEDLKSGGWTSPTAERSHPYSMPAGTAFPFPMLNAVDHYGDWPLPGFSDSTIGVFRYVYSAAEGAITISGGALRCDVADNYNKCEVAFTDPAYFKSLRFSIGPDHAAGLLPEGYGVFWSYGLSDVILTGNKKFSYGEPPISLVDELGDLAVSHSFRFVPTGVLPPRLGFNHGGGSKWSWCRDFTYDAGSDSFTVADPQVTP